MIHYCAECGDGFALPEYRPLVDAERDFCSDACEDRSNEREESTVVYDLARSGGAPVF